MISFGRVWALSEKEVRHVLRDPRTLYLALAMPVIMLLLFGYGVSFDLDNVPVAFVDADRSVASRTLRRRLMAGDDFRDVGTLASAEESSAFLVSGGATAVVVIERGWGAEVARGEHAPVQLLIDGADSNTAVQTRAKLEAAIQRLGAGASTSITPTSFALPIETRTWTRFNPEGRSAVFLVPGITAYVLAIVAVLLTALTVAREWERGSMAQLFATPVTRIEIVLGKLLPYMALGTLTVMLVLAVGMWVFNVPFRGDVITLSLLSFLFITGMLGQGLLISIMTRNQMAATQIATMTSMLPSLLLSGFMFPIENMPPALQAMTLLIPARYYVEGLRGVLLRGNSLADQWPQVLALAAFSAVMIVLSTLRFRRTIA